MICKNNEKGFAITLMLLLVATVSLFSFFSVFTKLSEKTTAQFQLLDKTQAKLFRCDNQLLEKGLDYFTIHLSDEVQRKLPCFPPRTDHAAPERGRILAPEAICLLIRRAALTREVGEKGGKYRCP